VFASIGRRILPYRLRDIYKKLMLTGVNYVEVYYQIINIIAFLDTGVWGEIRHEWGPGFYRETGVPLDAGAHSGCRATAVSRGLRVPSVYHDTRYNRECRSFRVSPQRQARTGPSPRDRGRHPQPVARSP
jgi:hypothetical protein